MKITSLILLLFVARDYLPFQHLCKYCYCKTPKAELLGAARVGLAYNYVALPAALLSFAAMSSLLLYGRYKRQQTADGPCWRNHWVDSSRSAHRLLPDAA